ncbi:MAG: VOC family protein [Chloroflexota bacterium]
MNSKPRFGFVVEYVPDLESARRFYVDVLGLTVERAAPTFVQFKDASGASGFAIASDEPIDRDASRELYWVVDDAQAACQEISREAEISAPLKQMPFGTVFGVRGPAGQPQYLLEWAKSRPSQQVG